MGDVAALITAITGLVIAITGLVGAVTVLMKTFAGKRPQARPRRRGARRKGKP